MDHLRTKNRWAFLLAACVALAGMLLPGCSDEKSPTTSPPPPPPEKSQGPDSGLTPKAPEGAKPEARPEGEEKPKDTTPKKDEAPMPPR